MSGEHKITTLCRVLNVNRSTYYKYINHKESKHEQENKYIRYLLTRLSYLLFNFPFLLSNLLTLVQNSALYLLFSLPVLTIKNMHLQKCLTFGVHFKNRAKALKIMRFLGLVANRGGLFHLPENTFLKKVLQKCCKNGCSKSAKSRNPHKRQAHIRTLSKSDRLRAAQRHRDLKLCGVVLFYS